jgi:hypothetical protein
VNLEEESLLGIDGERFARANAKEGGLEVIGIVEKTSFARVAFSLSVWVGIEEGVELPSAIFGEAGDSIFFVEQEFQRSSGVCTPPGKRQLIATMAMGSSLSAVARRTIGRSASRPRSCAMKKRESAVAVG